MMSMEDTEFDEIIHALDAEQANSVERIEHYRVSGDDERALYYTGRDAGLAMAKDIIRRIFVASQDEGQ